MAARVLVLLVVLVLFGALTVAALLDVGFWGITAPHFTSLGAGQVFADLVILAALSCVWMAGDAPTRGLPAWPFILLTLVAGSFGPLTYLLMRELRRGR